MLKPNNANESSHSLIENSLEEWLSAKQAAQLLSITPNAIRIMICRGYIPKHKLRGRLRVRKSDCLALIQKIGA